MSISVTLAQSAKVGMGFGGGIGGVGSLVTFKLTVLDTAPGAGVCIVVTPLAVLGCTPTVVEVTRIVTVQLPLIGKFKPVRANKVSPSSN